MRWRRASKGDPVSIVVLLRKPHFFDKTELQLAAERAWRIPFDGKTNPLNCVAQLGAITLIKAGPHLLNLLHFQRPYLEGVNSDWLPKAEQKRAWEEHSGCVAVDYIHSKTDLELAYCVLAKFAAELIDENCSGIYVPGERSLVPHDRELYTELQTLASSRDMGITRLN